MKQMIHAVLRGARVLPIATLFALVLTACPRGDVGAPCNHGRIEPPDSKLVTFPALSCNDLLCVYGDEEEALEVPCDDDLDCNTDPMANKFECVVNDNTGVGACRLRISYVLERSMCSKRCNTDADCEDGGVTDRVLAKDTQCELGFECARIQSLGEFCCEKLCVCVDDLGSTADLDDKCSSSTQEGCCVGIGDQPVPEACGKP